MLIFLIVGPRSSSLISDMSYRSFGMMYIYGDGHSKGKAFTASLASRRASLLAAMIWALWD